MVELSRAFWEAKGRYYKGLENGNPWGMVTGPLAATITTMVGLGWQAISPFVWIDHEGSRWEYSGRGSLAPILEAVRDAVSIQVWGQAAKHHNGKGVEGGIETCKLC